MDKSPNPDKSTGDDKPKNAAAGDAGSSGVTPRPPPSPATGHVPSINAITGRVTPPPATAHSRILTTPTSAGARSSTAPPVTTPGRIVPTQANPGSGASANRADVGAEQKAAAASSVIYTGGSSAETSQIRRKRNRTDHELGGGSSSRPRFDGPVTGTPIICSVCGKQFISWKALFGHMRSHPERQWRGVFPPPTFNRDGSPEHSQPRPQQHIVPVQPTDKSEAVQGESSHKSENDFAYTLLKLAKGCLEKLGGAGAGSSSGQKRIVLDVDLNVALASPVSSSPPLPPPPPPFSPPRCPTPPPRRDGDGHLNLDLNKSPPEDQDQ